MSWESDGAQNSGAGVDRSKVVWTVIVGTLVVMLGALWWMNHRGISPYVSQVRLKHILITYDAADPVDRSRALETINKLRSRLVDGERFSKIAKDYSGDTFSAPRGGDLGWMPRGKMVDSMESYAWKAPLNTLSEVIKSSYGFHLAIVTGRQLSDYDIYEQGLRERTFEEEAPQESAEPASDDPPADSSG